MRANSRIRGSVLMLSAHEAEVDRRVVAEANALAGSGRLVTLVETSPRRPQALREEVVWVGPSEPGPGSSVRPPGLRQLVRHLPERWRHRIRELAYRIGFGADRLVSRQLRSRVPGEAFDVVHCHDLPTLAAGVAIRAGCGGRSRLVYDSHELFAEQFPTPAFRSYWAHREVALIGEVDAVVTVNSSIATELRERLGCPEPTVVYNSFGLPYDANKLLSRAELADLVGDPEPSYAVVFQGYWTADRNLEGLIEAFSMLGPDFRLYLFGRGPLEARVRLWTRTAPAANVFVGGWLEPADLILSVAAADLGVIPYQGSYSLNHRLCTPNKLFEFIEARIPICASDLPELRRLVEDRGVGHVAPMDSPAEIAEAVRDTRRYAESGAYPEAARESAREELGWRRQARRLLGLYDSLGC